MVWYIRYIYNPFETDRFLFFVGRTGSGKSSLLGALTRLNICIYLYMSNVSLTYIKSLGSELTRCLFLFRIGRTGSGKSSLLGALTRLYPTESGEMRVDGKPT